MAALTPGSTITVARGGPFTPQDDGGWRLEVDGEDRGHAREHEVRLGELDLRIQRTGERFELVTETGTPVLRFDPAGRKATTLTLAGGRYRLARQRPRPLLHRWRLTHGVHGDGVLRVDRTPLGTRLTVDDDTTVAPHELAVLALGALVEVLDMEPAAAPV